MLSDEFTSFCLAWFRKSKRYSLKSIPGCFDRFFTLFVVYNKLYSHSAIELAKNGQIPFHAHSYPPDRLSATEHVLRVLPSDEMIRSIHMNPHTAYALEQLKEILLAGEFNIILSGPDGSPNPLKDRELCDQLQSQAPDDIALGILNTLYHIRCNLFHGHKGFAAAQLRILAPVTRLLESVSTQLYERLGPSRR